MLRRKQPPRLPVVRVADGDRIADVLVGPRVKIRDRAEADDSYAHVAPLLAPALSHQLSDFSYGLPPEGGSYCS